MDWQLISTMLWLGGMPIMVGLLFAVKPDSGSITIAFWAAFWPVLSVMMWGLLIGAALGALVDQLFGTTEK